MRIGMKEKRRLVNEVLVPVMEEKEFEMTQKIQDSYMMRKDYRAMTGTEYLV